MSKEIVRLTIFDGGRVEMETPMSRIQAGMILATAVMTLPSDAKVAFLFSSIEIVKAEISERTKRDG